MINSILDDIIDPVIILQSFPGGNPPIIIKDINAAFCKMSGYIPKDIIGRSLTILCGPDTNKKELQKLEQHLFNQLAYRTTLLLYNKNGQQYWAESSLSPVKNTDHATPTWVLIIRDVTDWKINELAGSILSNINNLFNTNAHLYDILKNLAYHIAKFDPFCMMEVWLVSALSKKDGRQLIIRASHIDVQRIGCPSLSDIITSFDRAALADRV